MKLIVCVDDRNGMAFHGRRQSMDQVLRKRIQELTGNNTLRMNGYSAKQFDAEQLKVHIDEHFLDTAGPADYCFVETDDVTPYIARVDTVVLYHWNRSYPADLYFPAHLLSENWKCASIDDFPGNSHERITQEVYVR